MWEHRRRKVDQKRGICFLHQNVQAIRYGQVGITPRTGLGVLGELAQGKSNDKMSRGPGRTGGMDLNSDPDRLEKGGFPENPKRNC